MWSHLFQHFKRAAFAKPVFVASSAAIPPAILWFLPDWLKQKPLREEDVEPDPLLLLLKKAKLAEMRKEYPKSEELYHEGLKLLHSQFEAGAVNESLFALYRLHIYDMMANAAYARQDLTTAESLFKTCILGFINELGYSPSDLAVVEVSLKLAIIYAMLGRHLDAELGYKYCINTMQTLPLLKDHLPDGTSVESSKKQHEDADELSEETRNALGLYGMCLDAFGRFLIESSRYEEAIPVGRKAAAICRKVFTNDHPTSLSVQNMLGLALAGVGEAAEAEKVFQSCVTVAKKALDEESALANSEIKVEGVEIDPVKEQMLARVLCACQCNIANTLLRRNLTEQENAADRELSAKKFCYNAKLVADKYKDDNCAREVRTCLAKFQQDSSSKQTKSKPK